ESGSSARKNSSGERWIRVLTSSEGRWMQSGRKAQQEKALMRRLHRHRRGDYGANGDYGGGIRRGDFMDQQPQQDNGEMAPNGFDTGVGFQPDHMGYATLGEPSGGGGGMGEMPAPEDIEPSALDEFMEGWQASLEEKAAIEAEAKEAALEAAKADLETHALERAEKKESKMIRNREQEQVFLEQLEGELES
ncbi:unnamed protein product, partial [Ascophyllum nodosum]